jgi:hypothetical protein
MLSYNIKIEIHRTVILPAVLYGVKLTLRLSVFENGVLRKVFGPYKGEVTEEKRRLYNKKLHDL